MEGNPVGVRRGVNSRVAGIATAQAREKQATDALREEAEAERRRQRQRRADVAREMQRNAVIPPDDQYKFLAENHDLGVAMRNKAMEDGTKRQKMEAEESMRASLEAREPMEVQMVQTLLCVSSDIEGGPLALKLTKEMRSKAMSYAEQNILIPGYVHCGDAGDIRGESMEAINFLNGVGGTNLCGNRDANVVRFQEIMGDEPKDLIELHSGVPEALKELYSDIGRWEGYVTQVRYTASYVYNRMYTLASKYAKKGVDIWNAKITPDGLLKDSQLHIWFTENEASTPKTGFFKFSDTTGDAEFMTPRDALVRWGRLYEEYYMGKNGSVFDVFKKVRVADPNVQLVTNTFIGYEDAIRSLVNALVHKEKEQLPTELANVYIVRTALP